MSDDLLERATAAYREATHEEPSAQGLHRLERALEQRPAARRPVWLVLPLAAALLVGTAWGSGALARLFAPAPASVVVPSPAPPPPVRAELPAPALDLPAAPAAPAISVVPSHAPRAATSATAKLDLDALYRTAHTAQFTTHDARAALAGWDRYLAAADPSARLLLEARYNRALTLRDLGRAAEARAALQPFAEGDYGAYRRDEAKHVLETLP